MVRPYSRGGYSDMCRCIRIQRYGDMAAGTEKGVLCMAAGTEKGYGARAAGTEKGVWC